MKALGALCAGILLVAAADGPASAKLILVNGEGVAVTDFSSMARCEAARAAIVAKSQKENAANPPRTLPGGGVLITPAWSLRSMCIPA